MPDRLPWQRSPDGFIAYPDGDDLPTHRAVLAKNSQGGAPWQWWVGMEGVALHGSAHTSQEGADAATEAWPKLLPMIEARRAAERERVELEQLCAQLAESGDATPLDVRNAAYDRLIAANRHLREHLEGRLREGREAAAIEAVMAVISAELYARRMRGEVPA